MSCKFQSLDRIQGLQNLCAELRYGVRVRNTVHPLTSPHIPGQSTAGGAVGGETNLGNDAVALAMPAGRELGYCSPAQPRLAIANIHPHQATDSPPNTIRFSCLSPIGFAPWLVRPAFRQALLFRHHSAAQVVSARVPSTVKHVAHGHAS